MIIIITTENYNCNYNRNCNYYSCHADAKRFWAIINSHHRPPATGKSCLVVLTAQKRDNHPHNAVPTEICQALLQHKKETTTLWDCEPNEIEKFQYGRILKVRRGSLMCLCFLKCLIVFWNTGMMVCLSLVSPKSSTISACALLSIPCRYARAFARSSVRYIGPTVPGQRRPC